MYSETVIRHFQNPHKMHALPNADVVGQMGAPGEGPFLTLYLRLDGERIVEACFETYGCPSSIASGSWMTQWLEGRTIAQAQVLDAGDLMQVLGGLPLGKEHAAIRAVDALRQAIAEYTSRAG